MSTHKGHMKTTLLIQNKLGLHTRAAAQLSQLADRFASDITIHKGKQAADGKSILDLMILAASFQTQIELEVTGEDAEEATQAITALINAKFNEEE